MADDRLRRGGHLFLAALLGLFSHPAMPATIVVDETTCTLVDAITAANTDSSVGGCTAGFGSDTLELTTDVTLTAVNNNASGPNGLPVAESEITIEGGGFTVERAVDAPHFRLFKVEPSGSLTLNDIAIRNGRATDGGGIHNGGTANLNDATVFENTANSWGGGIFNSHYAVLTIVDSDLTDNVSFGRGGGIKNFGTATVVSSTISNNSLGCDAGCGIYNGPGVGATLVLSNSTVSGHSTDGYGNGMGILNRNSASLIMTNSTVSGNTAVYGYGAGIVNYGSATLRNSTISGNSTVYGLAGGILGGVNLSNCIVANNSGGNCGSPVGDDGNNFADDGSCGAGFADITPDVDFDTTLADNGGPTQTHALLPGSVAIDAAGDCGLETDQRGFPRDDGACDSGSFEFQGVGGDGGADVPASSGAGMLLLLAILASASWGILRPKRRNGDFV